MKILLIHGLGRTPFSLRNLGKSLQAKGFETELFGYWAMVEPYARIVARLQTRIQALGEPYGIVAHSLGGLLARSALSNPQIPVPNHVVMLGTPNQPPRMGALAHRFPPFRLWSGQCGDNLANPKFFDQLPRLAGPYMIIAGTAGWRGRFSPFGDQINDMTVGLDEVRMGEADLVIELPVIHSLMMDDPAVQAAVVAALGGQAIGKPGV
jgi:pimeloyl-ACP methyl ester carboxylesterase